MLEGQDFINYIKEYKYTSADIPLPVWIREDECFFKSLVLTFAEKESSYGKYLTVIDPVKSYMLKYDNNEWMAKPHGYFHIMGANMVKKLGITEKFYNSREAIPGFQVNTLMSFLNYELNITARKEFSDLHLNPHHSDSFSKTGLSHVLMDNLRKLAALYYGGVKALTYYREHTVFPKSGDWDVNEYVQDFIEKFAKHYADLTGSQQEGYTKTVVEELNNVPPFAAIISLAITVLSQEEQSALIKILENNQ